jgi:hypothetical protein
MSILTRIKLALALIGVAVFAAGVRYDYARLRFVGIGFVFVAWVLRFVRPKTGGRGWTAGRT